MPRPLARSVPRVGAFFDVDKTIIAENSGTLFFKHRYQKGQMGSWDLAKGLAAYLQYKIGILDIQSWTKEMMVQFRGPSERVLVREANQIFKEWVKPVIYPEAAQLVREHREAGHLVVIVSGATKYVVRPLAECLGVKHFLYTRLETENGRFTGRVIEPVCFEEGKIYWLQQLVDQQRIDLAKSWFYTDSITDLPLLELVGHPVVVNPDPRIYRTAVRRRWPVRFFTPPEEGGEEVAAPALRAGDAAATGASSPSPRRRTSAARP
jgi:putative phosphoserine phosphatase/1-acylglycerol-3-phosphate O-acyltransferase